MADECELKGGHAQAVKAGGKRIVQHRSNTSSSDKHVAAASDVGNAALKVSTSPPKQILVPVHAHNDYPTEAVQNTHTKPLPSHDMRQHHCPKPSIHQPRK